MKYAVEVSSAAMIHKPIFINIGFGIQKLIVWDIQTHRQDGDRVSIL